MFKMIIKLILKQSMSWFHSTTLSNPPACLRIEHNLIAPFPLPVLFTMTNSTVLLQRSVILKSTKLLLQDIDSIFKSPMSLNLHSSLWYNPMLKLTCNQNF